MQPVGMLAGCRPCSSLGLPLLHAMQRLSLRWQGAKEVTVDNAVKPPGEGRWEAGGQSQVPGGGRLQAAAAGSQAVTWGDKAFDGWTSEGLKVFVLFG